MNLNKLTYCFLILLPYCFGSCINSEVKEAKDLLNAHQDSFLFHSEFMQRYYFDSTRDGFKFDTLFAEFKKPYYAEELILPVFLNTSDSITENYLRNASLELKKDFMVRENAEGYEEHEDEVMVDSSDMQMTPVIVFRNKRVVSYCFQLCYTDNNLMRPYCEFKSMNYDLVFSKKILFSDYFRIDSPEDSVAFKDMVLSSIGVNEYPQTLTLDNLLSISFDDEYVYFLFEPYSFAPFNNSGGIRKKFLNKYINPLYQ
jgi:hypothetical protein